MKHKFFIVAALTIVFLIAFATVTSGMQVAEITYLQGKSFVGTTKQGPWKALAKGMQVAQGQFIRTDKTGIVEITLPDRSVVRLAPNTLHRIDKAYFPEKNTPRFTARLFFGKMWAKVSQSQHIGRGRFDIKTPTAIVGVRGTVYNVNASKDKSVRVSVYEGLVAVSPPLISEGAAREEISWPKEVLEKKWEEIILGRLQRLYIGSDGFPGKPELFDPVIEKDEWADWNLKQDAEQASGNSPLN